MSQVSNGTMATQMEQFGQLIRLLERVKSVSDEASKSVSSVMSAGSAAKGQLNQGITQTAGATSSFSNSIEALMHSMDNPVPTIGGGRRLDPVLTPSKQTIALEARLNKSLAVNPQSTQTHDYMRSALQAQKQADATSAFLGIAKGMSTQETLEALGSDKAEGVRMLQSAQSRLSKEEQERVAAVSAAYMKSLDEAKTPKQSVLSDVLSQSRAVRQAQVFAGLLPSHMAMDAYDVFSAGGKLDVKGLEGKIASARKSGGAGDILAADAAAADLQKYAELSAKKARGEEELLKLQTQATASGSEADVKVATEAAQALRGVAAELKEVAENAKRADKALEGFDGGGGDGPTFGEKAKKTLVMGAKILSGVTAAAGAGFAAYAALDVAAKTEMLGKDAMLSQNTMMARGVGERSAIERYSMESPENLMKQYGDILAPGRFKYLGSKGYQTALAEGMQLEADKLGLSKSVLFQAKISAGSQAAGGVAKIAAGVASGIGGGTMGAAMGATAAIGGASDMSSALTGYLNTKAGNDWAQLQGGVIGGIAGWTQDMSPAERERRIQLNKNVILTKMGLGAVQHAESQQNLEVQSNPIFLTALQESQKMITMRQRGIELVGTHAWTEKDIVPALYKKTNVDALTNSAYGDIPAGATSIRANDPIKQHSDLVKSTMNVWVPSSDKQAAPSQFSPFSPEYRSKMNALAVPYSPEFADAIKNAPTTRQTYASERGMSLPEYLGTSNMVSNYVNTSGKIGLEKVNTMIDLSRSGLGDMSSLLSNLSSMNRVSGGQDNIEQLKMVLGTAVAMGFDKSRTAQQFVQTTMGVADALKLTRIDLTGAHLKESSKWQSATLKADERSLAAAAQGMTAYDQMTASKSGMLANVKAIRLMEAGASSSVLAAMEGMSESDAREIAKDINSGFGSKSKGMDTSWTRNQKGADLMNQLRTEALKAEGLLGSTDSKAVEKFLNSDKTKRQLAERAKLLLSANTGMVEPYITDDVRAELAGIKAGGKPKNMTSDAGKTYTARVTGLISSLTEDLRKTGQFEDAGAAKEAAVRYAQDQGLIARGDRSHGVSSKVQSATKMWKDAAQVKMAAATGEIVNRTVGRAAGIGISDYEKMLTAGSVAAMPVNLGGRQVNVTPAVLDYLKGARTSMPAELEGVSKSAVTQASVDKELRGITEMDWARSSEFQSAPTDAQSVRIVNAGDIGAAVAMAQRDSNPMSAPRPADTGGKGNFTPAKQDDDSMFK